LEFVKTEKGLRVALLLDMDFYKEVDLEVLYDVNNSSHYHTIHKYIPTLPRSRTNKQLVPRYPIAHLWVALSLMLVAKLDFRTLLFENCNILKRQIAAEPTKFWCMPNKLDQRLLWKFLPIVASISTIVAF
jgi:hypothetical protein